MIKANTAWIKALSTILNAGVPVEPRGKKTVEVPQRTDVVRMRHPVVVNRKRALNYRFMAAEAYWILSGSNVLSELTRYNPKMAEFSDDGVTLFGAYGPPIQAQLDYVVSTLLNDEMSRQAVLTIWRQRPAPTKDVPCTVAMSFMIRDGELNAHVFMRSNDVWLGWPYDVFSFSMVAHLVCCRLNAVRATKPIEPGNLYLTAASSHLYQEHWTGARVCLDNTTNDPILPTPPELYLDEGKLMNYLFALRETQPGNSARWWEDDR